MAALARIGVRHLKSAGVINSPASCFLTQRRGVVSRLFVGGLSISTTEQGLSEAFSKCGQVVEAEIIKDRVSDRPKGFGFVTFASDDEAHKALMELNRQQLNGRVIYVDYAKGFVGPSALPIARGPPGPTEVIATTTETSKSKGPPEPVEVTTTTTEASLFEVLPEPAEVTATTTEASKSVFEGLLEPAEVTATMTEASKSVFEGLPEPAEVTATTTEASKSVFEGLPEPAEVTATTTTEALKSVFEGPPEPAEVTATTTETSKSFFDLIESRK